MSEVTATDDKLKPLVDATGGGMFWTRASADCCRAPIRRRSSVPRISMLSNAQVLAGSGWMGLKDREAFVTRGVKLTPMFTGLSALAVLLLLVTLAWWREGRVEPNVIPGLVPGIHPSESGLGLDPARVPG